MITAQLIIVKLNTVARTTNEFIGPFTVQTQTDFKEIIQHHFNTDLKGIAGYILVKYGEKLFQCERNNVHPDRPYVRHEIKYHPLAEKFVDKDLQT